MGNRVKGRVKKKSIKAASHSGMGSKRKLSRMGKKQKRHNAGLEATFIGRSKCIKMLQITIKDFRRLCILKGIYPREPRGRVPGNKKGQTFYHIKDIRAIAHEPVLEKFREFRAFMKKIRRAAGRDEKEEALRRNAVCPTYTLHHLVRERYPRFQDALSDLDDALTLTFLFAALPTTTSIKAKTISKAKQLAASWGALCATTACITKSFISVKGVYLEASIQNIPIRWVVPHSFTQFMPQDVDYRVMTTFFEFYETLLHFVLYKLYADMGVRYPLVATSSQPHQQHSVNGSTSYILGATLRALTDAMSFAASGPAVSAVVSEAVDNDNKITQETTSKKSKEEKKKEKELIKSVGAALNSINEDSSESEEEEENADLGAPLKAALESMAQNEARSSILGSRNTNDSDDEALKRRRLFSGLTFFLSREVPRGYLELVCLAYGGKVGWEGINSPLVADDPSITHHLVDRPKIPTSFDSLPKSREFVQPQWVLDCANFMFLLPISKYAVGAMLPPHLSPWVDNEEEGYTPKYAEEIECLKRGDPAAPEDADAPEHSLQDESVSADEGALSEEEEDVAGNEESDHMADKDEGAIKARKEKRKLRDEEEAHELAKTMMSRKASHLYGRMQHGIEKKRAKVEALEARRKEFEQRSKKNDERGRTPLKQKVDRLKAERKHIMEKYSDHGGSMSKSKRTKKSQN